MLLAEQHAVPHSPFSDKKLGSTAEKCCLLLCSLFYNL